MELNNYSLLVLSFFAIIVVSYVESAPSNSTATVLPPKVNATTAVLSTKPGPVSVTVTTSLVSNNTHAGNKTGNDSEEDCEPDAEPETVGGKNGTAASGPRQGKQLNLGDSKDKYTTHDGAASEPEPEPEKSANSTSLKAAPKSGDAEKLQGGNSSSTTVAPSQSGAGNMIPSSLLWANVIFTTLLASFTYSAL